MAIGRIKRGPQGSTSWPAVGLINEMGELGLFAAQAIRALPGTLRYSAEVLRQTALLVKGSTAFLAIMQGFFSFAIVNFAFFFFRTIGASDYVGLSTGLIGPRLGVIAMFGYVFASKICCGLAAELGSSKISEEIDAYETEGIDPFKYVIGTRVWAALLFIPLAAAISVAALSFAGYVQAVVVLGGLESEQFYAVHWSSMALPDLVYMFIAMASTAFVMVLVACFYGYRTHGAPQAVGQSVARSLVVNLMIAHVVPAFWTMTFYSVQNANLSIGG